MSIAVRVAYGAAALAAVACVGESSNVAAHSTVDSTAGAVVAASGVLPSWRVVSWEPYAGVEPGDLGVGVAALRRASDKAATLGTDTLIIRAEPNVASPAVGAVLFTVSTNGVLSYQVASPDTLRPNLAEFGYEESGVPFDSLDATGRWARAILGFANGDSARIGWVDLRTPGVETIRWVDQLADRPLFYPRPELSAFFATPDSSTPVARPRGGDDDYAMHPEEVRGPWMRVRLVTPSDNCVEPDSVRRVTRRAWIRYLDPRGRPNVWYYTRGC